MSAKQDVVFFCWRCGQKLAVPDTIQGKTLPCPRCQRSLTVPIGDGVFKRDVPAPVAAADELTVTENDMTFNCEHCDWILIMDKRGAGLTVPCPGCGRLITAPLPQGAVPPQGVAVDPALGTPAAQNGEPEL